MTTDSYRALAHYNRWMNERLYASAASLDDADRKRDLKAFFASIHGTLNHILFGDRIWMARFLGKPLEEALYGEGDLYADFDELRRERASTDAEIVAFADALEPGRLAAPFAYKNLKGDPFEHPLWYAVLHFFNHQTHHRGQVTTLLMQLGKDPGVTDLVALLRNPDWASA